MKLTRRNLRKQSLKEYSEYFGKEFTEFKSRYEKDEDPLLVAQSMLKEIGAGATRRVFEFSDNSTAVLKVINTDVRSKQSWYDQMGYPPASDHDPDEDIQGFTKKDKLQSNQWEADLTMQQLYPDVFPRTFEVADDYTWILSERVKPIKNFQELLGAINLGDETFSRGQRGQIQFQAIIEKAIEVLKPGDDEAKDDTLKSKPAKKRKPKTDLLKSRITKVLSNPHTRKMLLAIGDLDIPVREFSAKNLGISELSGKLMLLDASIWREYKPIRETVMKMNRQQLRTIIKEALAEGTDLSKNLYGSLEKAIADSKFWLEGNTEDDGDYEDVPGLDLIHQTSAAQYLQDVLQTTIDNAGEDIIIAVQSPELDANPGFLLTPDKPQYPDSVISGGYATITPDGKQAVVLNMSLFDDAFNDDDVNPERIARKGAGILRHEMVHLQQVAARAESEGISLLDAFENFKKEPKAIPPAGSPAFSYSSYLSQWTSIALDATSILPNESLMSFDSPALVLEPIAVEA